MVVEPKKGFSKIISIIDSFNPFLVILSIVGLFLEYSDLKRYVLFPNQIISILFVIDFTIRFIAFDSKNYFFKAYGWVDFLASLPGFLFFLGNTPLLTVFKIVKVGRFFRIIRILRFLRVFSFLKRMRADSTWIQDRIMQIGVTIVLVFVVGIIVVDSKVKSSYEELIVSGVVAEYHAYSDNIEKLVNSRTDILFFTNNSSLINRAGLLVKDFSDLKSLLNSEVDSYLIIQLEEGTYSPTADLILPIKGIIISGHQLELYENRVMLALLTTLLFILTIIIFYMGYIFAKDMQIIQLVIDSFDAGDDLLLKQEAEQYKNEDGELYIEPNENELISLLKVSAKVGASDSTTIGDDPLFTSMGGFSLDNSNGIDIKEEATLELEEIKSRLDRIESKLDQNHNKLIEETFKKMTPALTTFIKKNLKR